MTQPTPQTRRARRILTVALLVLCALHVAPPPGDPQWILLGVLPWDLAYPLLWILAAALVVVYMTGPAWPDEPVPPRQPPLAEPPPEPPS